MRGSIRESIWPWMSAAVVALVALVTAIGCCGDKPKPVDDRGAVDVEVEPNGRGGRIKVDIDKDGRPIIDVDLKRGGE